MPYIPDIRIIALPPWFDGLRKPGTIKAVREDKSGTVYDVLLDGHRNTMVFRDEDLEDECAAGGAHVWMNEICERCFEGKEQNGEY